MKTNIKRRTYQTVKRKNQKAMWKLLLAVTLGGVTAILSPFAVDVLYGSTHRDYFPKVIVHAEEEKTSYKSILVPRESVEETIRRIAKETNFKWADYLVRLAVCESGLNPNAVNGRNNNPAHSKDRGLFQINNYWHKNVPDSVAFDVEASTRWAIEKINNGGQGIWVCDYYVKSNPTKYNP